MPVTQNHIVLPQIIIHVLKAYSHDAIPASGARVAQHTSSSGMESRTDEAACAQAAANAAGELATYWSNSVRPMALRGSPFIWVLY